MNKISLALIKAFFTVTSRITPQATSRLAFKLFCTTIKPNTQSAKYQAMLSASNNLFASANLHNIAYEHGQIAAYEFTNGTNPQNSRKGSVLLVHGWQSHARHLYKFIQPLLDKDLRVVAIDLPGHGQSSGRTFHIPMGVSALHAVNDSLGEFDTVLSHSLGGTIVGAALAGTIAKHPKLNSLKVVLISSPNAVKKLFDDFAAMVGLSAKARSCMEEIVEHLSGKRTEDFTVATQLQMAQPRVMLVHAPDDKEVPFTEAESIATATPSALLKPMPGLGHRRIISSDKVVQLTTDFITN